MFLRQCLQGDENVFLDNWTGGLTPSTARLGAQWGLQAAALGPEAADSEEKSPRSLATTV